MLVESVSAQRLQVDAKTAVKPKPKAAEPEPSTRKKEEKKPDVKLLQEVFEIAQEHFQVRDIGLKFSVHEQTGRIKVTVLDKKTGEMIREIPPQRILSLMAKIDEMMGILFDHRA